MAASSSTNVRRPPARPEPRKEPEPVYAALVRRCAAMPAYGRRGRLDESLKRAFDFAAAGLAIALLLPLLLGVAFLVRATSPGPIVYRGLRTGRRGHPFHVFKFRTMVVDAERLGGTTTGQRDPRVTRVGHFLRELKLDELPQLFNVLRGEMSFVGPRPEVYEYTTQFTDDELRILSVRPGITDYSSMRFSDLQSWVGTDDPDRVFRERILPQKNKLRLKYVDERSLPADLAIIVRTVLLVFRKLLRKAR